MPTALNHISSIAVAAAAASAANKNANNTSKPGELLVVVNSLIWINLLSHDTTEVHDIFRAGRQST